MCGPFDDPCWPTVVEGPFGDFACALMHLPEEYRRWVLNIVASDLFKQTVPFLIFLVVPAVFLFIATSAKQSSLLTSAVMGFEAYLPWMWSSSSGDSSSAGSSKASSRDKKKKKDKKAIRTRAEQLEMNGIAKHSRSEKDQEEEDEGYYPGLVNVSGTYCFMNSTLQALASLAYLQPHIDAIHAKAEALDVPTPVIDALKDLFQDLNNPRSSYHSIRPMEIISVLSQQTQGRTNSLFYSREHQDAQELFQVVSECIKNELVAVDKEGLRDRGFGAISQPSGTTKEIGKSVFDGLTANRRSCVICGYTEAVMHFAFDNWQLSMPRMAASCRLEDCLEDYTRLEILKDCICRKCSLVATHKRLEQDLVLLEEATKPSAKPSRSKKNRLKDVRKFEARVRDALAQGRIEDDLKDVRIEKVFSPASTKQAMVARPPPVLALHLNRSIHYGTYAGKNNCKVLFPEVLDLTPFTTSGSLSTVPTASISTPAPPIPRSTTPTPSTYATPRTIYRLSAVVCHFGGHSFGHYICYRRRPRSPSLSKAKRFAPPVLVDPLLQSIESTEEIEDASSSLGSNPSLKSNSNSPEYLFEDGETQPGKGWLRISDDSVRECGIESVMAEGSGVFMLYYERAIHPRLGIYGSHSSSSLSSMLVGGGRASEETLKPEMKTVDINGSVGSIVEVGVGVLPSSKPKSIVLSKEKAREREREAMLLRSGSSSGGSFAFGSASSSSSSSQVEPRVIRSVAAGRGRSGSARPSSSPSAISPAANPNPEIQIQKSLPNGHADPGPSDSQQPDTPVQPGPSLLIAPSSKIPRFPLHATSKKVVNGVIPTSPPRFPELPPTPTTPPKPTHKNVKSPAVHSPKPMHPPNSSAAVTANDLQP